MSDHGSGMGALKLPSSISGEPSATGHLAADMARMQVGKGDNMSSQLSNLRVHTEHVLEQAPQKASSSTASPIMTSSTSTYKAPGLFGGVIVPPGQRRPDFNIDFGGHHIPTFVGASQADTPDDRPPPVKNLPMGYIPIHSGKNVFHTEVNEVAASVAPKVDATKLRKKFLLPSVVQVRVLNTRAVK
jgi:hypothetical protein